jgi:hypothetical protein
MIGLLTYEALLFMSVNEVGNKYYQKIYRKIKKRAIWRFQTGA